MEFSKESLAEQFFGSKLKRKLLEFLLSNQEPVSERELSRMMGVSHVAVNKAMKQLLKFNVVEAKTIGASLVWKINDKSFAYPYVKMFVEASNLTPLEYVKKELKGQLISTTKYINYIDRTTTTYSVKEAYIFGSFADETDSPESDIDVLIILDTKQHIDFWKEMLTKLLGMEILDKLGRKLSFHIYDVKAVEKNEPHWLKDAISKGVRVL